MGSNTEVFHSTDERGEHSVSYKEFEANTEVQGFLIQPVAGAWERLAWCKAAPRRWSASHNCQHTASWIFLGHEQSPTLDGIVIAGSIALVAGTLYAASAHEKRLEQRRRQAQRRKHSAYHQATRVHS